MNVYLLGMIISFVIYVVLGFLISLKVKNANDYYVAGRRAPVFLIVGSMIASYVSTGLFMGDAAEFYSGIFSPMMILCTMQVVGYIIGAVFIGRYLRRSEVMTIPQFFGKRFNSKPMRVLSTTTAIITMCVYLLSVVMGIGTLMSAVTGLDYRICVVLGVAVFTIVTLVAGSRGVLITDTLMFSIFTSALIVSAFVIVAKAGGWVEVINDLVGSGKGDYLSWGGREGYMYSAPMNIVWGFIQGILWMSVCMTGPWQSSRYLMAKNEHVVIRSSIFSALGVFLMELLVGVACVSINKFLPATDDTSRVMIWAATNNDILPTILGVILLTGVLAAGISSGTTFLSLIGSSVANDAFEGKGNSIRVGKIAMLIVAAIVCLLGVFNPPQIFWVLYFGGAIVASSWMPVSIASIVSKRVTKVGAFAGMATGFVVCFVLKLVFNLGKISYPAYLDPTLLGIVANIIAMVIGSAVTKVTEEEKEIRAKMFIVPESEKDPKEIKKTKWYLAAGIGLGAVITATLILVWVVPYLSV